MNAIVFVVTPARESQSLVERVAELTGAASSPAKATPLRPKTSKSDAPFWTWFIENPRGGERAAV